MREDQNACHNFVTVRTKFSVIRPYPATHYVTVIYCVMLHVLETERVLWDRVCRLTKATNRSLSGRAEHASVSRNPNCQRDRKEG